MEKSGRKITVFLFAAFVTGLSLVLYPSISNYWNLTHQTREIAAYAEVIAGTDEETFQRLLREAEEYNASLLERENSYGLTEKQKREYPETMNLDGSGAFGYIEIPSLSILLPIYHGTSEAVLQRAVGHLAWTSLPVGGESTHTVLSGHRGLPSSRLFTDLDKLVAGDIFMLQIMDETLTYEVDRIEIVEPEDATPLLIEKGRDLCTLVTCTPYGINTHRLLVRGHRIANREEQKLTALTSEAVQIEPMVVAPVLVVPLISVLFLFSVFGRKTDAEAFMDFI